MAALARLLQRTTEIDTEYFRLQRIAQESLKSELPAAIRIQATARGHLVRKRLQRFRKHTICIQSCWRGYTGRQASKQEKAQKNALLREAYFDAQATHIQRWFRGYWSRKYIHNFSQRKAYLAAVADTNARMRVLAEEAHDASSRALREQEEEAAMAKFQKKASKLHHLLSTSNVPGIYRSPYQALTNTVPLLDNIPIEDQIRANRKSLMSTQTAALRHQSPLKAQTERRSQGYGLSLQASTPYDAVRQAGELERRVCKALQMRHGKVFTATVRAGQDFGRQSSR